VAIESAPPFVIPIYSPEERARRAQRFGEHLASWRQDDQEEQRETMAVLREALGSKRTLSGRPLFS
jgi:hypothetical protein